MALKSALALLLLLALPAQGQDHPLAIEHVTLIPMDSARTVPGQTVVVHHGRITALGPSGTVPVPEDAERVDGTGRFLLPGLADLHTHLALPETDQFYFDDNEQALALLVAHGVTTARVMWGTPALLALRDRVNAGALLGPRLTLASPFVDGRNTQGAMESGEPVSYRIEVDTPEEARAAIRQIRDAGYDYAKAYNALSPVAYRALLDEAEALGVPVVGHAPWAVGVLRVLADGRQASLEHLSAFAGPAQALDSPLRTSPDWWAVFGWPMYASPDRVALLADVTAASGMPVVTTLLTDAWYSAPQSRMQARLQDPEVVRFTPPAQREAWRGYVDGFAANYDRWGVDMTAHRALALDLVRALHDAGATLLLGTDDTPALTPHGLAVHEELALLVEAGLSPFEALRAATVAPQAFLKRWGLGTASGTLAVGEPADLVLLGADPLADIAHTRRIEGVVAAGRWLDRPALDALLARVEATYAEAP